MTSATARLAAALSVVTLLAACGGSGELTRDEAMKAALDAVASHIADPTSGLYHHRISVRDVSQRASHTWLVRIRDRSAGELICVDVRTVDGAIGPTTNVAISPCGAQVEPAGPAPSEPASA